MILGKVVGRAVSSRKDEKLLGTKLLLVEEIDPHGSGTGDVAVVADHIGAGAGDVVLVTQGSAARFTEPTKDKPLDALVVGIVDDIRVDGATTFSQSRGFGA
jgi:microcompartment protein CcmK/EutM